MEIKQKHIDCGKPLICVSVAEQWQGDIEEKIKKLISLDVDMIEWRVDWFEGKNNPEWIEDVLNEIAPYLKDTVFLYTDRTRKEGGMGDVLGYKERLLSVCDNCAIDLIDVEIMRLSDKADEFFKSLHQTGRGIVASYHDFNNTPGEKEIKNLASFMYESGADIAKIAVMPHSFNDASNMLKYTYDIHNLHKKPFISISMGEYGKISRLIGEVTGSCVTFAFKGNESAAGQVDYEDCRSVIDSLHKALGKENVNA